MDQSVAGQVDSDEGNSNNWSRSERKSHQFFWPGSPPSASSCSRHFATLNIARFIIQQQPALTYRELLNSLCYLRGQVADLCFALLSKAYLCRSLFGSPWLGSAWLGLARLGSRASHGPLGFAWLHLICLSWFGCVSVGSDRLGHLQSL